MSIEQVTRACIAAGFEGDALVRIVAIAGRESGWDADATNDTRRFSMFGGPRDRWYDPTNGDELPEGVEPEYSVGPFQININQRDDEPKGNAYDEAQARDYTASALLAYELSREGTDFSPWSTNTDLPEQYIEAARNAVEQAQSAPQSEPPMSSPPPADEPPADNGADVTELRQAPSVTLDVSGALVTLAALQRAVQHGDPVHVAAGPDAGQVTVVAIVPRAALVEAWPALDAMLPL